MASPHAQLNKLRRGTSKDIREIVNEWADGALDWDDAVAEMEEILRGGHIRASGLGRLLGGDRRANLAYDRAMADLAWNGPAGERGEGTYFRMFDIEVRQGKYGWPNNPDNPPNPEAVAERANRWHGNWVATANEAWIDKEDADTVYIWHTAVGAQHCADCASFNGQRYKRDDLPAIPGDRGTRCLYNCRCWLETEHGTRGFAEGAQVG